MYNQFVSVEFLTIMSEKKVLTRAQTMYISHITLGFFSVHTVLIRLIRRYAKTFDFNN